MFNKQLEVLVKFALDLLTNAPMFYITAPSSRPGSRPASRANSDMSTGSVDGYNQRKLGVPQFTPTGMRRTPSGGASAGINGRERWK